MGCNVEWNGTAKTWDCPGSGGRYRATTLRAPDSIARATQDPMNRGALSASAFPLTAKYDPRWIRDNALGENALCQVESLARRLPLRAGMRVLDLGCGKATSSIFLAREFGIEAWAADAATSPLRTASVRSPSSASGAYFPCARMRRICPGRVRRCRRITRSSFVDRVDLRPLKRYIGDQAFLTEYEGKDGFLQSLAVIRATGACFNQSDSRVGPD